MSTDPSTSDSARQQYDPNAMDTRADNNHLKRTRSESGGEGNPGSSSQGGSTSQGPGVGNPSDGNPGSSSQGGSTSQGPGVGNPSDGGNPGSSSQEAKPPQPKDPRNTDQGFVLALTLDMKGQNTSVGQVFLNKGTPATETTAGTEIPVVYPASTFPKTLLRSLREHPNVQKVNKAGKTWLEELSTALTGSDPAEALEAAYQSRWSRPITRNPNTYVRISPDGRNKYYLTYSDYAAIVRPKVARRQINEKLEEYCDLEDKIREDLQKNLWPGSNEPLGDRLNGRPWLDRVKNGRDNQMLPPPSDMELAKGGKIRADTKVRAIRAAKAAEETDSESDVDDAPRSTRSTRHMEDRIDRLEGLVERLISTLEAQDSNEELSESPRYRSTAEVRRQAESHQIIPTTEEARSSRHHTRAEGREPSRPMHTITIPSKDKHRRGRTHLPSPDSPSPSYGRRAFRGAIRV